MKSLDIFGWLMKIFAPVFFFPTILLENGDVEVNPDPRSKNLKSFSI